MHDAETSMLFIIEMPISDSRCREANNLSAYMEKKEKKEKKRDNRDTNDFHDNR